ncbi:DUF6232 family protein [Streptomyces sp. NPDC002054]|uniref:DUF6232 family protein n=1 Tax=Streptomyces sp. NPDC002054 TaxID=3154663 RepID=UPI00332B5E43
MESTGPQTPPPPSSPPAPQSPPTTAPAGAPAANRFTTLDLTITKRILWVGTAAYPLQNVARIYTFTLHPRRKEATLRFFRRAAVTVLVLMGLSLLGAIAPDDSGVGGFLGFAWLVGMGALIWFFVDWLMVVFASSHFAMAVESNGPSTALVTGSAEHLTGVVHKLAYAIEHPDTELRVQVERLTISNPRNYYYGDAVNMYGGNGNVGVANA